MKDKILQAIAKMEEAIAILKSIEQGKKPEVHTEDSTPTTPPTGEHPGRP